ncbi:MAG: gliding motility protein GldN [Alloprevotella sp.]|nr:gliding motility protein GldN [Alloprevotella sp.]
MKRFILFLISLLTVTTLAAQPARRRNQQTQEQQSSPSAQTTQAKKPAGVSYRDFPTAQPMPADVSWRRDVYRILDLSKDENATLYYPTMPQDGRQNLFSYIFYLLRKKMIKAYDTKLDANDNFSESNTVSARALMDRYKMYYERDSVKKTIRINDADIPSDEVKLYYIKESVYYNQNTATFHSRVTALCPVLVRGDVEFGGTEARYPMFWVKYDDIAPYLGKLPLTSSNYNNAATLSADDFFTMGRYKGDIYRTVNLQDRLLSDYCQTDSDMLNEQQRIEGELLEFRRHVWGADSVATKAEAGAATDSVQASGTDEETAAPAKPRRSVGTARRGRTSSAPRQSQKATKPKKQKVSTPKSSGKSGGGLSVRRQRH